MTDCIHGDYRQAYSRAIFLALRFSKYQHACVTSELINHTIREPNNTGGTGLAARHNHNNTPQEHNKPQSTTTTAHAETD